MCSVCAKDPLNSDRDHKARTGTTLNKHPSTQFSALPCAMSVAGCEQPTHQAVTYPFLEQLPSSASATPSCEQFLDHTIVMYGGNSNVDSSMSLSESTSNSFLNSNTPATSVVPPAGKPEMRDPSSDQLPAVACTQELKSPLKRIHLQDPGTPRTNSAQHPLSTIVVVPSVEGENLLLLFCFKLIPKFEWEIVIHHNTRKCSRYVVVLLCLPGIPTLSRGYLPW